MIAKCPVYKTMKFAGKKWALLVLLELYKGTVNFKRYSEIKRKLPGITPKVLSMRLKELEGEGMIEHVVYCKDSPIKSVYGLTPCGEDFIKVLKGIKTWSLKWKSKDKKWNDVCKGTQCKQCNF